MNKIEYMHAIYCKIAGIIVLITEHLNNFMQSNFEITVYNRWLKVTVNKQYDRCFIITVCNL